MQTMQPGFPKDTGARKQVLVRDAWLLRAGQRSSSLVASGWEGKNFLLTFGAVLGL